MTQHSACGPPALGTEYSETFRRTHRRHSSEWPACPSDTSLGLTSESESLTEVWAGSDHREVQAAAGRLRGLDSSPQTVDDSPYRRGPDSRRRDEPPGSPELVEG